ncbi:MAG: metal-sensing transcriptional repressor [Kiritimatiellae bacterium]|nr:metal-sensing transcriptional repressor [Kiritimatiellia bacterium]
MRTAETSKILTLRLNKIIGQLSGIKKMIENGKSDEAIEPMAEALDSFAKMA